MKTNNQPTVLMLLMLLQFSTWEGLKWRIFFSLKEVQDSIKYKVFFQISFKNIILILLKYFSSFSFYSSAFLKYFKVRKVNSLSFPLATVQLWVLLPVRCPCRGPARKQEKISHATFSVVEIFFTTGDKGGFWCFPACETWLSANIAKDAMNFGVGESFHSATETDDTSVGFSCQNSRVLNLSFPISALPFPTCEKWERTKPAQVHLLYTSYHFCCSLSCCCVSLQVKISITVEKMTTKINTLNNITYSAKTFLSFKGSL